MSRRSWSGQVLGGRYRIDEILGQGGMSAVYKAYDPNLKRVVAVKMIHPHLAGDPKFLVRFEEEAAAVAQLRHPNIVQVWDFNHDGDQYYMVQEFVPGETLQERLRRLNRVGRRLSVDEVIRFTLNICEATGYAHRLGMIHRDIKPANIMLSDSGQAVLMDFGIVKITAGQQHTATGAVVGTAVYLPPEIIRGETADPRSDIYSLGVTLFEMVSGRPPFEADSAMTLLMMHLHDPVPDLRLLRPEVPDDLMAVIEKALAKNREDRYRSMAEMASALRGVQTTLPAGSQEVVTLVDDDEEGDSGEPHPPLARAPVKPEEAEPPAAGYRGSIRPQPQGVSAAQRPAPGAASYPSKPVKTGEKVKIHSAIWIGAPLVLLTVVLCGSFFIWRNFGVAPIPETRSANNSVTEEVATSPAPSTATPTPPANQEPTATGASIEATSTLPALPPGLFPTVEVPAGRPFAMIDRIGMDANNRYVVEYETFEYFENNQDMHVHFFFNTVPAEEAGRPGSGPWILYGGPRPFTGYGLGDRPVNAAGMCILVANPDHSIQLDSGNCVLLPDIVAAAPLLDSRCYAGPGSDYPPVESLSAGQVLLVRGISPDESWWNVAHPTNPEGDCWLPMEASATSGDISILPLVEPPPLPTAPVFSVEITGITIDAQNRYVVDYRTQGFTESLPGTHMHFFFNTVAEDQVGIEGSGQRLMHGGPTPFTGYRTGDRPASATELCVLVANPDHSVIFGSGSCRRLPDVP